MGVKILNLIEYQALCFISSLVLGLILSPLIIKMAKKLKAGQSILQYVDNHLSKAGTPTFGGTIFIFSSIITLLIFGGFKSKLGLVSGGVMFAYGILGFLDDFIKIKFKQNLGLKAYQKLIGQLGIAIIVTIFCYKNYSVGTYINIPFLYKQVNLNWWYIPCCMLIFLATTNAVNLTDGLDGLAGGVSSIFFIVFAVILSIDIFNSQAIGDVLIEKELTSLACFNASFLGGILAFLCVNTFPAKIFMGDTGSMAIGGAVCCVAIFSRNPLLILLVGIMYVVSCISVIIQVLVFKAKRKRVFLMAPYHHHLQYKGFSETQIGVWYAVITIICGCIAIVSKF